MVGIQAWQDENSTTYVWGTHDPFIAKHEANQYFDRNLDEEDKLDFFTSIADWEDRAQKLWARPDAIDREIWEPSDLARTNGRGRESWVPLMILEAD